MRANRAYRLIVTRGGATPALLDPERIDHIEIVEIDSGEVVLFWDCMPTQARRLARRLRADLVQLDADEFVVAWRDTQRREAGRATD